MKKSTFALIAIAGFSLGAAAIEDDDLNGQLVSTDTARGNRNAVSPQSRTAPEARDRSEPQLLGRGQEDEEDEQAVIQESDSDLAAFVRDYIAKDCQLKGAFFIESPAEKKILSHGQRQRPAAGQCLRLKLVSVEEKTKDAPDSAKTLMALFADATGKKYEVLFYLQSSSFGGAEISKIELKQKPAAGAVANTAPKK